VEPGFPGVSTDAAAVSKTVVGLIGLPRVRISPPPLCSGRCLGPVYNVVVGAPMATRSRLGATLVGAVLLAVAYAFGTLGQSAEAAASTVAASSRCDAARVHYKPYKGVQAGLAVLPWIAASPSSAGVVGHLFYYDGMNVWRQQNLPRLHIYHGGQSPEGRVSMKILWELRRGGRKAAQLDVRGNKLDGSGTFSEQFSAVGGGQFPSIIDVPTRGCWRLTLTAGTTVARVTVLAV
jgi:hypothetical protein